MVGWTVGWSIGEFLKPLNQCKLGQAGQELQRRKRHGHEIMYNLANSNCRYRFLHWQMNNCVITYMYTFMRRCRYTCMFKYLHILGFLPFSFVYVCIHISYICIDLWLFVYGCTSHAHTWMICGLWTHVLIRCCMLITRWPAVHVYALARYCQPW